MSFRSPWSKIPLRARWAISLLVGAACVVALVLFVHQHSSNGEVPVSAKKFRAEDAQAQIVIGQEQAPHVVAIAAGTTPRTALVGAVRRDMNTQITQATIDGPLQRVHCVVHGGTYARTGYHCLAQANHIYYYFLAVATAADHRVTYCEKVYPPSPSENIRVSGRCQA